MNLSSFYNTGYIRMKPSGIDEIKNELLNKNKLLYFNLKLILCVCSAILKMNDNSLH